MVLQKTFIARTLTKLVYNDVSFSSSLHSVLPSDLFHHSVFSLRDRHDVYVDGKKLTINQYEIENGNLFIKPEVMKQYAGRTVGISVAYNNIIPEKKHTLSYWVKPEKSNLTYRFPLHSKPQIETNAIP